MNSLQQLNNYAATDLEFTDLRPASVAFDRAIATDLSTAVNEGQSFNLPVGIEIEEIINYEDAATYYQVNVSAISGATVTWTTIPSGCTVTNPSAGVYRISVLKNQTDWQAVRSPLINLPNAYFGLANIIATVSGGATTKSWTVATTVNNVILLTTPDPFFYLTDSVQNVTEYPQIQDDGTNSSLTYTVEIQPQYDLNGITNMTCAGTGGTVSYNAGTQTLTISGNKTQVNSRLANIRITFTPENDLDFPLRYVATASSTGETDTVFQEILGNDTSVLGRTRTDETYETNTAVGFSGGPLITDTGNPGTGIYTLDIYPDDLDAFGSLTAPNTNSNYEYLTNFEITNSGQGSLAGTLENYVRTAISEDGRTMVIGMPEEDNGAVTDAGFVYVYIRQLDNTWALEQKFRPTDSNNNFRFGEYVSVSGDGNMIAAYGLFEDGDPAVPDNKIYIWTRTSGVWTQAQRLNSPTGSGVFQGDVAISSDKSTMIACGFGDMGKAYVYSLSGSTWSLAQTITSDQAGGSPAPVQFVKCAVSADGNTVIFGAPGFDTTTATLVGCFEIWNRSGSTWSKQLFIDKRFSDANPSDGAVLGASVAISADGNKIAVGAPNYDLSPNTEIGYVMVYTRSGSTWSYQQTFFDSDITDNRRFGRQVKLSSDGRTMAVGTDRVVSSVGQGRIRVYFNNVLAQSLTDTDTDTYSLGRELAMSGNSQVLVGRTFKDITGADNNLFYIWQKPVTASYSASTKTLTLTGNRSGINALIDQLTYTPATGYSDSFDMLYYLSTPTNVQSLRNQAVDPE